MLPDVPDARLAIWQINVIFPLMPAPTTPYLLLIHSLNSPQIHTPIMTTTATVHPISDCCCQLNRSHQGNSKLSNLILPELLTPAERDRAFLIPIRLVIGQRMPAYAVRSFPFSSPREPQAGSLHARLGILTLYRHARFVNQYRYRLFKSSSWLNSTWYGSVNRELKASPNWYRYGHSSIFNLIGLAGETLRSIGAGFTGSPGRASPAFANGRLRGLRPLRLSAL